jgi:hypothetical protein
VASITACVPLPPGKEDRLNASLEKLEIQGRLPHPCSSRRDHQNNQSHRRLDPFRFYY